MEGPETFEELGKLKGLKIAHLNVRSLLKKVDQIRLLMEGVGLDVLTVSETWLRPHISSDLVDLKGYQTFRQDRYGKSKSKKRGGGLISYVNLRHGASCEYLEDLSASNEHIEAQWIYIHRPNCKNVIMCNVYRPPSGNLKKAVKYLEDCLKTLNLNKIDLFLLGDFNINYKNKRSPDFKKLYFFTQSNGLTQYIKNTTRNNNKTNTLLDLAITNSKSVLQAGTLEHFVSDHQPIYIVHKKGRDTRQSAEFWGRSYRNFDVKIFKTKLLELNWEDFFKVDDPGDAWELMLKNITSVLDVMCPVRVSHIKNFRPDWMTKELIEQIKDRDYFYKKAKSQNDDDAWNIAKHFRNSTNSNIRQAKREFILRELQMHDNDPKKFWKVIHKVLPTGKSSQKAEILLKNGGSKIDKEDVAHFVNSYFVNVGNFKLPDLSTNDHSGPYGVTLDQNADEEEGTGLEHLVEVREVEVFNVVKDINVSKSSGIEDVSSFVVKEAFKILITEVTHLYNLSIRTSTFPSAWKRALVVPIPKAGNLTQVKNYRPISLLPLPGKILEKLIHQQLSSYLEGDLLLVDEQHGFRKNHSTIHFVSQLTNYISKKLDNRIPTLAAYVDFRKAFDCVQHPLLLAKLGKLGVGTSIINWVRSYLSSREQRVCANGFYSCFQRVTQGVPQGSVLGPLFYIIYANDLSRIVNECKIAMYADDTVLFTANPDFEESIRNLQNDMNSLNVWCNSNGIMANTEKTKVMVFGNSGMLKKVPPFEILLNGVQLQTVTAYKYLGITLDTQLSYNLHVNKIIGSITAKLKQFQRMLRRH